MPSNIVKHPVATSTHTDNDGNTITKYHDTNVVTLHTGGAAITLNTGGYFTSTTKRRFNQFSPANVHQKDGQFFVTYQGKTIAFQNDAITLDFEGNVICQLSAWEIARGKHIGLVQEHIAGRARHDARIARRFFTGASL